MDSQRKYGFHWGLLGDLDEGRPNLGPRTRLEVYRLMQYCFRDVLEARFGTEGADDVFYRAGYLAGTHFHRNYLAEISTFEEFIRRLQELLKDLGIGILRIEKADLETGSFVLTVSEDLDCSGLPVCDSQVCIYDEGFIAALLEAFTGKPFRVKEVDCWCSGDRTCRFTADPVRPADTV